MKLPIITLLFLLFSIMAFAQETTETPVQPETTEEPVAEEEPVIEELICSQDQCDNGCIKCSDRKCHEPNFECIERIAIEKIFPKELTQGESQINIGIKNTGNVDLKDIFAEISGDGISTLERISISKLAASDKDYTFVKIDVTKSGKIDVVIKIYVDEEVKGKFVDQFNVAEKYSVPPNAIGEQKVNITLIENNLNELRIKQNELETIYQEKNDAGYSVDLIYDKLKQTSAYVVSAQTAMIEGDYKKVQASIVVLQNSLPDIESRLNSLKKQEESFGDKIKNNLLFFGSIAAALISILTAYKLISSSVDHKKLLKKLGKKKFEALKRKKEEKKKKEIELDEA